jgi:hypothetical protein
LSFDTRPLIDFAPDKDPLTRGIVLDADGFYPTEKGARTLPAPSVATPPLPSACIGSFVAHVNAGIIVVAGTVDDLYMLTGGVWVAQGLTVSPGVFRWRFSAYGNDIIAVNGIDPPVVSINGAAFGLLGGTPPIADTVQASDYSIFLDTADSFNWWSTLSDIIWTPGIPTETVTAPITATPGIITALVQQRSTMTFWKRTSFYVGQFTGPPFFWNLTKVSSQVGVASQENPINVGDILYFIGPDDFYSFDGFNLNRIPNSFKEWFFRESLDVGFVENIASRYDEARNLIFWHYPSISASPRGSLDKYICLNVRTGRWLPGTESIEIPLGGRIPASTGLTYDQFGAMFTTYNDIPNIPYNSTFFGASPRDFSGVFLSDHTLYVFGDAPPSPDPGPFITGSDFGDRRLMYQVIRMRPGYYLNPGIGQSQVEILASYLQGTAPTLVQTVPMSDDGFFNVNVTARLQRPRIRVFAEAELVDYQLEYSEAGEV